MYTNLLPSGITLSNEKYCNLDSWQMCLIHVELHDKQQTFIIEKYQNHYGSIIWNSIFSNEKDFNKKEIISKIREKYPLILINEEPYIEEFKSYVQNNPTDYNHYKNHYIQEVEKINSTLDWLELRKILKFKK